MDYTMNDVQEMRENAAHAESVGLGSQAEVLSNRAEAIESMIKSPETDLITADHIVDGLEVTLDGYDIWDVYKDSGMWWVTNSEDGTLVPLGVSKEHAAKFLQDGYFTRA